MLFNVNDGKNQRGNVDNGNKDRKNKGTFEINNNDQSEKRGIYENYQPRVTSLDSPYKEDDDE